MVFSCSGSSDDMYFVHIFHHSGHVSYGLGLVIVVLSALVDCLSGESAARGRAYRVHVTDNDVRHSFLAEYCLHVPEIFVQGAIAAYYVVRIFQQVPGIFLFRKFPVVDYHRRFHVRRILVRAGRQAVHEIMPGILLIPCICPGLRMMCLWSPCMIPAPGNR